MADRPSQPHPAFVPPTLFDAPIDGAGDDDLRQRIRERSPFERRYQRQRGLASGQMSDLLLARDHLIGRAIAFKTLPVDRAGDRDVELRFLREATIQGQLEHPAIVPVYDLGVDPEGNIYFTMKRIRGINLDEILDGVSWDREGFRATYPRRRLIQALANVALAVDFAHRRGIIHRDLK
ncbi:MAG: protein kinase, partial [Myxococcales bacterium]|nr:protein kinase [Myxococcales bacterium]